MANEQTGKETTTLTYEIIDVPPLIHTLEHIEMWLRSNIPDFEGNISGAAILITSFVEGMSYISTELSARGLKFQRPKVGILLSKTPTNLPIAHAETDRGKLIYIGEAFLQKFSQHDMDEIYSIRRQDGEITFTGTIPNFFRLAGVEETHHTILREQKENLPKGVDPLSVSVAEYDAQEHEFRALKWQLRFARKKGIHNITIRKLQERLEAAKNIRNCKPSL